ncbi:MAG: diaminopimelate decarboxylase [Vulcanimicrobiaceae bacterium]|jgi:diaminopimelate decarboxylase
MIAAADPRVLCASGHTRGANGVLEIAGVNVDELAKTYGTPLVVFDASTFERTLERFHGAADAHGISIAYAGKALLFVALVRRIARHAWLKLDVCSSGEIATAERGGLDAAHMYLHGCGKTDAELDAAIEGRVAFIVVDGIDELQTLAARARGRAVAIGLRFNTGIEIHTHDFVRTGGENTKFGIAPGDLERALDVLDAHPNITLGALHAHMGSQIFDEAPYAANLDVLAELATRANARGRTIPALLLGGGFGVDEDVAVSEKFDIASTLADLALRIHETATRAGIPVPRLGIEPGRSLVASAGTTLYRVAAIKDSGTRRFVVIDGSIADNPRPAIYGAFHQPLVASSQARGPLRRVTIAGRSCENDVMLDADLPDDLRVGDLLVFCTTGAYTYSMASNYNRFGRPAVAEVESGRHQLVIRRENFEDVLRNDVV